MTMNKPIYVTQPDLPPLEEFFPYLAQIWENKILTNGGPFHQNLEQALCDYLGVKYVSLFTNGTVALLTALQALGVTGEVITTPYSFVATAHSLLWNGIKPVFVDIDPDTLNMDPSKIEAAITSQTTAILPVHCYGRPCDVLNIQKIAEKYNLRVIYDAAHAFGVKYRGESILNYGDISTLSFHATKVFNTFEGGAIVCADEETKQRIDQLKNFGIVDEVTVDSLGMNGKMSEVNAAFGLLQLKHVDRALSKRKEIAESYRRQLAEVMGEPVKIMDLATRMVHLSGLEVQGDSDSDDAIEIQHVGLRPGEKLYEELLIGSNVEGTQHPLIMRAQETEIPWSDLQKLLVALDSACEQFDYEKVRALLLEVVAEYAPQCGIEDFIWQENARSRDGGLDLSVDVNVLSKAVKPELKQVIK